MGIEAYKRLTSKLRQNLDYLYPEVTTHPADMLHSAIGPYAITEPKGIELARYILKQRIAKPLLGKKPGSPYKTVRVNNFNKLDIMSSDSI